VRGGTLYIGFTRDKWQDTIIPTKQIKYNLTVKDLTSIESSGAASIQNEGLKTSSLRLRLSGAGSVKLNALDASSVDTVTLSGLGSYRAGDLKSKSAKVTVSGAGSATVWATDTLNATISGVGSVNYYGAPTVSKTVSGVGSVKSLGSKE
jgi:hypothetical protein